MKKCVVRSVPSHSKNATHTSHVLRGPTTVLHMLDPVHIPTPPHSRQQRPTVNKAKNKIKLKETNSD